MAIKVGARDGLLAAAILAFLMDRSLLRFSDLPVSVPIGKQRGFSRVNRAVSSLLTAFLRLHRWSQVSIAAREHYCGLRFLHILADRFRLFDLALHQLEIAVGVGIRGGAHQAGISSRECVFFFLRYLHQGFCAIGIPAEGARSGSNRGCIDLYGCGFDVLVRFEMSVASEDLDRSVVLRAIATVGMALGGAGGIYITVLRLDCIRAGSVDIFARRTGSLRPKPNGTKNETGTNVSRDREQ